MTDKGLSTIDTMVDAPLCDGCGACGHRRPRAPEPLWGPEFISKDLP